MSLANITLANLARRLNSGAGARANLPPLILMSDASRLADPVAAAAALPRGAAIILRHYDVAGRAELARDLIAALRPRGILVLIAADPGLALQLRADGLHLPEAMARNWSERGRARPRDWLVTAAAHSPAAIIRAKLAGAHAVLVSPVFPTASHPEARTLGALGFARLCRRAPLPVYALGGITVARAVAVRLGGAAGIAGIGGFIGETE